MNSYQSLFEKLTSDPRYCENLDWGDPRPGHPEGSVRAHVREVDANVKALRSRLSEEDYWKLRVLAHTHDTFKAEAKRGVAITDPSSHSSLARAFLAEYCEDEDLLAMVQHHDEPFAIWRQEQSKGSYNRERFEALLGAIRDWNLFLAFNIADSCTGDKDQRPLLWLFAQVKGRVDSDFTADDLLT